AASSGEALAAGVIFTIPALLLVGYWADFDYWQTTVIATVGGLLGVLFTIPLRRALIVTARLRFPEGVATAEVLKVGAPDRLETAPADSTRDFRALFSAALLGGAVKFCESGFRFVGGFTGRSCADRTYRRLCRPQSVASSARRRLYHRALHCGRCLSWWRHRMDVVDAGIWTLQWSATRSNRTGSGDGDLERPDPLR